MSDPGPPARGQPSGARVGRLTPARRPGDTRRDDSLPVRIPPPRPRHEQPAENDPANRERDARRRWGTEERADVHEGSLAGRPQQRVVLLALTQEQVATGEPIGRLDLPGRILHALLVDVDATLLDCPARFALRFLQPCVYNRVH